MSIDQELESSLDAYVHDHRELARLSGEAASDLAAMIAQTFDLDTDSIWWWESAKGTSSFLQYSGSEWKSIVLDVLKNVEVAILFVTDDEPPPWVAIRGEPSALVDLVQSQRYFEFFIAAEDASWALFDTHHNAIVVLGRPSETLVVS